MANSLISMIKGDETLINNTEILEGQVLFDETNRKILLDNETERLEFGSDEANPNIAYVEEGATASRGYAKGSYVVWQGNLYEVSTQINSGTTFEVGTNIEATKVGDELTQINTDLTAKANNTSVVTSITRNGTTFTAKNSQGTQLFTFNQQDNDTTTGTSYNAGSCPDNTTFATNGSVKRVYDQIANKGSKNYASFVNQWFLNENDTISFNINGNLGCAIILQTNGYADLLFANTLYNNLNAYKIAGTMPENSYDFSVNSSGIVSLKIKIAAGTATVFGLIS